MKNQFKKLALCIAIPLLVGGLSALVSGGGRESFEALNKPPLSPPGWLFPVVWTVLYVLMGIASYIILTSSKYSKTALFAYGLQLFFNFMWPIFFFKFEMYLFSFVWLLILLALIAATIYLFYQISKPGAWLMVPYFVWVVFAGYLNLGIYALN